MQQLHEHPVVFLIAALKIKLRKKQINDTMRAEAAQEWDGERAAYNRVVHHFRSRTKEVDWKAWKEHARGKEGMVLVDVRHRHARALKVIVVGLAEDPIARCEMMEAVNRKASKYGLCPRVLDVYYALSDGPVLKMCIEQEFFAGDRLDALTATEAKRVMPLVVEKVQRMMRRGIVHNDLHGGNILVSPDRKEVRLIDFGNHCIDTRAPAALLQAMYLIKLTDFYANHKPKRS